jgi:VCBS repeat-containing protein
VATLNFAGKFDAKSAADGFGHSITYSGVDALSHQGASDTITIPDAHLLFTGDFRRSGVDLILSKNDHELILQDYFKGEKRAALASPDGARLGGDLINALTGHVQYAQASGAADVGKVIGQVTKLTGNATAIRNGVSIILNLGDNVQKGDVVQSGSDSQLGITFIDGTVFGLSSNARMVLNEMVYDPAGSNNSSLLSLVAGTITFVAGETAKRGDMKIDTPVATLGIRGTAVLVEIDFTLSGQGTDAPPVKFQVLAEPDGTTGSYVLYSKSNPGVVIGTVNQAGQVFSVTASQGFTVATAPPLPAEAAAIIQQVFVQKFNAQPLAPTDPNKTDPGRGDAPKAGDPNNRAENPSPNGATSSASAAADGSSSLSPGDVRVPTTTTTIADNQAAASSQPQVADPGIVGARAPSTQPTTVSSVTESFVVHLNVAPVITHASFTVTEGSAITLQPGDISVTDAEGATSFKFTVSNVTHGTFRLAGVITQTFDSADLSAGRVSFVHDGSEGAPTFAIEADDLTIVNGSEFHNRSEIVSGAAAVVNVNDAPILTDAVLNVSQGGIVMLSPSSIGVSDSDSTSFTFTVSGVTHGHFQTFANGEWSDADQFTSLDLSLDHVRFVHDGSTIAPAFSIQADDGAGGISSGLLAGTVNFGAVNQPPVIAAASLTVGEGATVPISLSNFEITDLDSSSFVFRVSGVTNGRFETAADGQTWISATTFSSADLAANHVRFVHDGGENAPTFLIQVDDRAAFNNLSNTFSGSVNFTGVNDAPTISAPTAAFTELAGTTDSAAPDTISGTIAFSDVDQADRPVASATFDSFLYVDAAGFNINFNLSAAQLAGVAAATVPLTVAPAEGNTNTNNGSATWTYTITDDKLDFLAAGEKLTLTYAAQVNDGHGGTATTPLNITITGTNDAVVATGATATGAISVPANAGTAGSSNLSPQMAAQLSQPGLISGLGGVAGYGENVLETGDDNSSTIPVDITSVFGSAGLNFFGHTYTSVYINNNGNITFGSAFGEYTPSAIDAGLNNPIIAPFWADVDTSTQTPRVYYDLNTVDGMFTATWDRVGYYSSGTDKLNSFQLVLINEGNGNFDISYRYGDIEWTTGDLSGGSNGLGGTPARLGYSAGDGVHYYEFAQSGNQAALLALPTTGGNTGVAGVGNFQVRNGEVSTAALTSTGTIGFSDADLSDIHTATSSYTGAGSALGTLTLVKTREAVEPNDTIVRGEFTWTYSANPAAVRAALDNIPSHSKVETFDVVISDGHGGTITQIVSVTLAEPPNHEPTGSVTISGTVQENATLTADVSTLADADGRGPLNFQWQRDSIDINNATGATYTLGEADVGHTIKVVVSYTDGQGTAEHIASDPSNPVAAASIIIGDDGANELNGTPGNDSFQGFDGDDIIHGLTGSDRAIYSDATAGITAVLTGTGGSVIGDGVGSDTLTGIELIQGSNFLDHYDATDFTGSTGFAGNPVGFNGFEGLGGNDIITGTINALGQALTRVSYLSATSGVAVDIGAGTAVGDASVGQDTFMRVNGATSVNAVIGSAFDDTLTGSDTVNAAYEQFDGRGGEDTIDGRAGYDIADYLNAGAAAGIKVELAAGTVKGLNGYDAAIGDDTLQGIEAVRGTNFHDVYDATGFSDGSANAGSIGTFNDFDGEGGDDTIIGNGNTRLHYSNAAAGVTVDIAVGLANGTAAGDAANIGTDTFSGVNAVMGSMFRDELFGSANNEQFQGLVGDDFIDGRGGFDTAQYSNLTHSTGGINVELAAGRVTGNTTIGTDTLRSIEGVQGTNLIDTFDATNYASGLIDPSTGVIYANNGVAANNQFGNFNQFEGLGGNDSITGNGNTRILYGNATAGVTVNLANGSASGTSTGDLAGVGNDTITGGVNSASGSNFDDVITGNSGNNFLIGLIGADTLNGGGGADTITGGVGDDTIDGGTGADIAVYTGARSSYTVNSPTAGVIVIADTASSRDGTDTLTNVELVQFSDAYVLTGGGTSITNIAGASLTGTNTIFSRTIGGNETVEVGSNVFGHAIDLRGGMDTIALSAAGSYTLTLLDVEKLNGTSGDDVVRLVNNALVSNANALDINLGGGTDTLVLTNGVNRVKVTDVESIQGSDFSGSFDDTLTLLNNVTGVSVHLGNGTNTLNLFTGSNSLSNVYGVQTINGSDFADTATFTAGLYLTTIDLGDGDDTVVLTNANYVPSTDYPTLVFSTFGLLDVEHLVGGSENTYVTLSNNVAGLNVDFGGGSDTLVLANGTNSVNLTDVETISGSDFSGIASDDALTLLNSVTGVTVNLGLGANTLNLAGVSNSLSTFGIESINGTTSNDTLNLDGASRASNGLTRVVLGDGNDSLTLGAQTYGVRYIYADNGGADTISGFDHTRDNKIDLTGVTGVHSIEDIRARALDGDNGVVITFDTGDMLTLNGVLEASLTANDFVFAAAMNHAPTAATAGDHVLYGTQGYVPGRTSDQTMELSGLGISSDTDVTVEFSFNIGEIGPASTGPAQMIFGFNTYDLAYGNYINSSGQPIGPAIGFNTGNGDLFGIAQADLGDLELVGQWHHYAAIFHKGDVTQSRLYIDGVEQDLTQLRGVPNSGVITDNAQIGGWGVDSEYSLDGQIDDVSIWQGARTAAQVADDIQYGTTPFQENLVAAYSFDKGAGGVSDTSGNGHHGTQIGFTAEDNVVVWNAFDEDAPLVFSSEHDNAITVGDVDGDQLTVTLSVSHGTLNVTGTVLSAMGNSTGRVTLVGSATEINATLDGLTYTPAADFNGSDALSVTVFDGELQDRRTVVLSISPVNDAPVLTGFELPFVAEGSEPTLDHAPYTTHFHDPDNAYAPAGLAISAFDADPLTQGVWQYYNAGWHDLPNDLSETHALAINYVSSIRFVPVSGYTGTPSITVYALDANLGQNTSGTAYIDVTQHGGSTNISNPATITAPEGATAPEINTFNGAGGDAFWDNDDNWSLERAPTSGEEALISGSLTVRAEASTLDANSITIDGAEALLQLNGATLQGGTLIASNHSDPDSGGITVAVEIINGTSATHFDGSTLSVVIASDTVVNINQGATVKLTGSIENQGTIIVDPLAAASYLGINGSVTLDGGGRVFMESSGSTISAVAAGAILTSSNTIDGIGTISTGLTLINNGFVDANIFGELHVGASVTNWTSMESSADGSELGLYGDVNNPGTIQASDGGVVEAYNITIDNTFDDTVPGGSGDSGVLEALAGSTIELYDTTVIGGTLQGTGRFEVTFGAANQAGTIFDGATSGLDGAHAVHIAAETQIDVEGTSGDPNQLTLRGSIDNQGTIAIEGARLLIDGEVFLSGGGTIVMNGNTPLNFIGDDGSNSAWLDNQDNEIYGAGTIGGIDTVLENEEGGKIRAVDGLLVLDTGSYDIVNGGILAADLDGALELKSSVSNSGTIDAYLGHVYAEAPITNEDNGQVRIEGGTLEFVVTSYGDATFEESSIEVVFGAFDGNVEAIGTLVIGEGFYFNGSISGAAFGDLIEFNGVDFGTAVVTYVPDQGGSGTGGILSVLDGNGNSGSVYLKNLDGHSYRAGDFFLAGQASDVTVVQLNPVVTIEPAAATLFEEGEETTGVGTSSATITLTNIAGNDYVSFDVSSMYPADASNHTYRYFAFTGNVSTHTWQNAISGAVAHGGYLATITTSAEDQQIQGLQFSTAYIGATDEGHEGDWQWATGPDGGTTFWNNGAVSGQYSGWRAGDPGGGTSENFGIIDKFDTSNVGWNDVSSPYQFADGYIVEYQTYSIQGQYGYADINTGTGAITYHLDDSRLNTQELFYGQHVVDTIDVPLRTAGGATSIQPLSFSITGSNDAPVILAPATALYNTTTVNYTPLNRISFADVDRMDNITVTFSVVGGEGEFNYSDISNVTETLSEDHRTLTLSAIGSLGGAALINAGLAANKISYFSPDGQPHTVSVTIYDGRTTVSDSISVQPVSVVSGPSPTVNNFAGTDLNSFTFDGADGHETVFTGWSHLGSAAAYGDTGITDEFNASADTIYTIFTPSQLNEILSNGASQTALKNFLTNPGNGMDLSATSWNGKVLPGTATTGFDEAHIELANLFSTTDSSAPADDYTNIDTVWNSVFRQTAIASDLGTSGNDLMVANNDHARSGGAGNDVLVASSASPNGSVLGGGADNDLLLGGIKNDTLIGGEGRDVLAGGRGADTFKFEDIGTLHSDIIVDFNYEESDRIDVSSILDNIGMQPNSPIGQFLRLSTAGNDIVLQIDTGGAGSFLGGTHDVATLVGMNTSDLNPIRIFFGGHDHVLATQTMLVA